MQRIMFLSTDHVQFYNEIAAQIKEVHGVSEPDVYQKALIYILGLSDDCRKHFAEIFDVQSNLIQPKVLASGWQTSGTTRLTLFAFNLWNDFVPDDFPGRVSVSELFSGDPNLQPYLFEAIKLRYPMPELPL